MWPFAGVWLRGEGEGKREIAASVVGLGRQRGSGPTEAESNRGRDRRTTGERRIGNRDGALDGDPTPGINRACMIAILFF